MDEKHIAQYQLTTSLPTPPYNAKLSANMLRIHSQRHQASKSNPRMNPAIRRAALLRLRRPSVVRMWGSQSRRQIALKHSAASSTILNGSGDLLRHLSILDLVVLNSHEAIHIRCSFLQQRSVVMESTHYQ